MSVASQTQRHGINLHLYLLSFVKPLHLWEEMQDHPYQCLAMAHVDLTCKAYSSELDSDLASSSDSSLLSSEESSLDSSPSSFSAGSSTSLGSSS